MPATRSASDPASCGPDLASLAATAALPAERSSPATAPHSLTAQNGSTLTARSRMACASVTAATSPAASGSITCSSRPTPRTWPTRSPRAAPEEATRTLIDAVADTHSTKRTRMCLRQVPAPAVSAIGHERPAGEPQPDPSRPPAELAALIVNKATSSPNPTRTSPQPAAAAAAPANEHETHAAEQPPRPR
jgi:hypothetical protein